MSTNLEILKSVRPDFTEFLYVDRLSQRCGVPPEKLRRLVVKELVDNALDAAGTCELGELPDGGFFVEDTGPGLPVEDLGSVFSVGGPMQTTKLERMPTRGALGNGLRVVTGAVIASQGDLTVWTRDRRCMVTPQWDGMDAVVEVEEADFPVGTRIEVRLGDKIPADTNFLQWGKLGLTLCGNGSLRECKITKPSPWWYDVDALHELCHSAPDVPVRAMISRLEGCTGGKAGQIARGFLNRTAGTLSESEIETLLTSARALSKPINPERLGAVGENPRLGDAYVKITGTAELPGDNGSLPAIVAYVIEAWARPGQTDSAQIFVNRSPIVVEPHVWRKKNKVTIYGGEWWFKVKIDHTTDFWINIQTPHVRPLSSSKAPDLRPFAETITTALEKAGRRLKKSVGTGGGNGTKRSQKAIIIEALPEAITKASGEGKYRYSLRQLFYVVRPVVLDELGEELEYGYFSQVITDHEDAKGEDLPGIYRDSRGIIYHPHTGQVIPLGTISVEDYRRPEWTFNKILYSEKEGFFEILRSVKWPERHDCALLTSKGYASRAARDLIDLLGETDEPIEFYCIHDADGPGTCIFQALTEATAARPGRRVEVENLGLEPHEGEAMGLQVESVQAKRVSVAGYVPREWRQWLQNNRIELNAMTTPQFLEWLDRKFEKASSKVIPPAGVIESYQEETAREFLREQITDRILREAGIDGLVDDAFNELAPTLPAPKEAQKIVRLSLEEDPVQHWKGPLDADLRRRVRGITAE